MCLPTNPFCSPHDFLGTCDLTLIPLYFLCADISCIFFKNGCVNCSLGESYYHDSMNKRGVLLVYVGTIIPIQVK